MFDKNLWTIEEARLWLKENRQKSTKAAMLSKNRLYINAGLTLCDKTPKLALGSNISKLTADNWSQAEMNDKYYFYTEGVHEGFNSNNFYFFRDELTENYKSASYQPIDWEHMQEQIIGFSLESELLAPPNEPLALAFSGLLHRLTPYMQKEERVGDNLITRDDLIRQRYFEDKLAVSMECFFDRMRCTECGYETADWLDFEFHLYMSHSAEIDAGKQIGMGGVGIDFVGWGIVEYPADNEAYITSLRTSDDGTIQDIAEASLKEKYGSLADNMAFSSLISVKEPHDILISGKNYTFASEKVNKVAENKPKKETINDNNKEDSEKKISEGGKTMFKLLEKIAKAKNLSEVFVVAQKALVEVQGDKALTEEARTAFVEELNEVVAKIIATEDFKVEDIFDTVLANVEVKEVKVTDTEEIEKLTAEIAELKKNVDEASKENEGIKAELEENKTELVENKAKLVEKEEAAEKAEVEKKVDAIIEDIESAGVAFDDDFKQDVRQLILSKMEEENSEEEIAKFRASFIATAKQSVLTEGSNALGDIAPGGSAEPKGLTAKYKKVREKYEKK